MSSSDLERHWEATLRPAALAEGSEDPIESASVVEIILLVEEAPQRGLSAHAVGESIFTQAPTMAELHDAVRDAVRCHFEKRDQPRLAAGTSLGDARQITLRDAKALISSGERPSQAP